MRRFVVIGQKAIASGDFLLDDFPGTSGRFDVLVRCVRAAALVSHGLRRDVVVYLVLSGGPMAPRTLRIDTSCVKFLRPDERSLATLAKKALTSRADEGAPNAAPFVYVKPGVAVARGGLEAVVPDLGGTTPFVLEEGAPDLRDASGLDAHDTAFFIGDHLGFDAATRERIASLGATPIGVGPISLQAEDVVTVVSNELDRRHLI